MPPVLQPPFTDQGSFLPAAGIAKVSGRQVPRSLEAKPALAWNWFDAAPDGDDVVGSYGRVFDAIVLGRPSDDPQGPRMLTLEAGLFESGRPVLIAPPTPPKQLGENVLIAWNCSTEQARTTAFAMPLLRRAQKVTVLTVEGATVPGPTGAQMARSLKLNGIPTDSMTLKAERGRNAGDAIKIPNARGQSSVPAKVTVKSDSADGASSAPNTPCVARAATSTSNDCASPPTADAAENPTSPAISAHLRPNRSPTLPPTNSKLPNANA